MSGTIVTVGLFGLVLFFGTMLLVERFKDMKQRLAEKEMIEDAVTVQD